MTDQPLTMPTADHLMAMVSALRRLDQPRLDELVQPYSANATAAGILAVSILDLAARVAAYTGQGITYAVEGDDAPLGVVLGVRMGTLVQTGDAGAAHQAFEDAARLATASPGWYDDVLAIALGGLDRALRLTPAGG